MNKEVFWSLKREESIKNGLEALGALLHIEKNAAKVKLTTVEPHSEAPAYEAVPGKQEIDDFWGGIDTSNYRQGKHDWTYLPCFEGLGLPTANVEYQ